MSAEHKRGKTWIKEWMNETHRARERERGRWANGRKRNATSECDFYGHAVKLFQCNCMTIWISINAIMVIVVPLTKESGRERYGKMRITNEIVDNGGLTKQNLTLSYVIASSFLCLSCAHLLQFGITSVPSSSNVLSISDIIPRLLCFVLFQVLKVFLWLQCHYKMFAWSKVYVIVYIFVPKIERKFSFSHLLALLKRFDDKALQTQPNFSQNAMHRISFPNANKGKTM